MFGDPIKIGDRVWHKKKKEWGVVLNKHSRPRRGEFASYLEIEYDDGDIYISHESKFPLVERR